MNYKKEKISVFNVEFLDNLRVIRGLNIYNEFPIHFHKRFCVGIIEKGSRKYFYRGSSVILKTGDIFVVHPLEPHSCASYKRSNHNYKIFSIESHHINKTMKKADFKNRCSVYFPKFKIRDKTLFEKIQNFHDMVEYSSLECEIKTIYFEILVELFSKYSKDLSAVKITASERNSIILAKIFIEKNYNANVKLKEIAGVANLSVFHFNRLFQKEIGISPHAYLIQCRIKNSQEMLECGESIINAALENGFTDQSHFTKFFKMHVGVTPGNYKKSVDL
jgi:AraC-like DNA-binding protein